MTKHFTISCYNRSTRNLLWLYKNQLAISSCIFPAERKSYNKIGGFILREVCKNVSLKPWSNESNISPSSIQLCSPLLCLPPQGGETNPTFRPTFLEFRELQRCAPCNQGVHSIEFETLASNENLKQKKCLIVLPKFLIAIKQRRAVLSSTEHSIASG